MDANTAELIAEVLGQRSVRFEVGKTYHTRSICDSEMVISATIAKRTAKTVTTTDGKTFRLREYQGIEKFNPWGSYSMAPIISADKAA